MDASTCSLEVATNVSQISFCSQLLSKSGWTHVGHYFGWTTLTTPKWMHIFTAFLWEGVINEWKQALLPPYVAKQLTAQFHTQSPFSSFGYCCIVPSVPLVDVFNGLLWAGRNGLPPTPDTLHLGCSYHLHSSHCFLSTLGVVMLKKKEKKKKKKRSLGECCSVSCCE